MLHIPPTKPNRSNKQKTRATQKSLPFGKSNGGFGEKRSGEWAKNRKGSDRKSEMTRQKNKRGDIKKVGSN